MAEYNHRKREELAKAQKSKPKLTSSQYYGAGSIIAIGALGVIGYCIYQYKKGDMNPVHQSKEGDVTPVRTHKFEMDETSELQNGHEEYC